MGHLRELFEPEIVWHLTRGEGSEQRRWPGRAVYGMQAASFKTLMWGGD